MLNFDLLHHFLLLIIGGRFEARTIFDSFGDAPDTILGLVFVGRFVTHRTHFIRLLVIDSSRLVTFARMSLVT